jgi:hypothetical protein
MITPGSSVKEIPGWPSEETVPRCSFFHGL